MPYKGQEKRKYIRLKSVFPVEFSLIFMDGRRHLKKYQGFTHDVSKGGLCIRVRDLELDDVKALHARQAKLHICINISLPLFKKPIYAICSVAWLEETKKDSSGRLYSIGASYEEIEPRQKNRIINYARRLKWTPRITAVIIVFLLVGLLTTYVYQNRIRQQNSTLVARLVEVSERRNDIFKRLNNLNQTKIFLEKKIRLHQNKIKRLEDAISAAAKTEAEIENAVSTTAKTETKEKRTGAEEERLEIAKLQDELLMLQQQNLDLKDKIATITEGEILLERQLADIDAEASILQRANIQKMRDWISTHRNRRTGLVISYEGDKKVAGWSFTYDGALAVQAFLLFDDIKKASSILVFYKNKARKQNVLFYNAYDAQTGNPVEYTIHSGPNLWLAIAASKFTKYTGNPEYLKMAEDIADIMISVQKQTEDGSIKGGPGLNWVSTEHNMDAYALFNMLYELTKKEKYKQAKEITLSWLSMSAYNKPQGRFNRGKGDATIATDTFSWAIASIGPEVLKENGMDPDGIMEFAEAECKVKTQFYRPNGRSIKVVGFDFTKATHIGRGGIVSCEWTAQMIVAFKLMADYHRAQGNTKKASIYSRKAEYYLMQLGRMVISSPSPSGQGESCLPYASIDNVDTGHGWRVVKGRRTGSVAATIYYIFAQRGYNPLKL